MGHSDEYAFGLARLGIVHVDERNSQDLRVGVSRDLLVTS